MGEVGRRKYRKKKSVGWSWDEFLDFVIGYLEIDPDDLQNWTIRNIARRIEGKREQKKHFWEPFAYMIAGNYKEFKSPRDVMFAVFPEMRPAKAEIDPAVFERFREKLNRHDANRS